jgi:hypothetical protein
MNLGKLPSAQDNLILCGGEPLEIVRFLEAPCHTPLPRGGTMGTQEVLDDLEAPVSVIEVV